jgi:hypothetical protein
MPEPDFQKEVADFLSSHKRYKPTERNKLLLLEFLEDHDLDLTAENLDVAFLNLTAADKLDLDDPEETVLSKPVGYRRREFVAFRNGRPLSGDVRPL